MNTKLNDFYKSKKTAVLFSLLLFAVFFGVCSFIKYSDGDDAFFLQKIAEHPSLMDFTSYLTRTMNGRITATVSLWVVFKNSIWVWRVLNAAVMTAYTLMIARITKCIAPDSVNLNSQIFAAASFGIMGVGVFGYSCLWITGSVNYLWPCTAGLIAAYPYVNAVFGQKPVSFIGLLFSLFAGCYACLAQEQIGAVVTVFCFISVMYSAIKNKDRNAFRIIALVLMLAAFAILIASPANENRGDKEIARWMPEYADFGFGEKFFITYQWMMHSFAHGLKYLLVLLWIIIAGKAAADKKYIRTAVCVIFSVATVLSTVGLKFISDVGLNELDFTKIVTDAPRLSDLTGVQLAAVGWWSLAVLATLILIFTVSDDIKENITKTLMFLAALASMAIMFFSPTIYASGDRTLFVPAMLITLICSTTYQMKKITLKNILLFFAALGVTAVLQLGFENLNMLLDLI